MLGLSATHIRYLDNQRDMADELFDGCIASKMTLGQAIGRGILPTSKYVVSLYSYREELERYRRYMTDPHGKHLVFCANQEYRSGGRCLRRTANCR